MTNELQTLRGRVFFWIGLAVMPVFWLWWMSSSCFSRMQILAARIWAVVYLLAWVAAWFAFPALQTRVLNIRWMYSFIAFRVGFWLWIWLLFRIFTVGEIIMGFLVSMDAIAILAGLAIPALEAMPPHPVSLVFIVIPAIVHLLLDPIRRRMNEIHGTP